MRECRKIYLCIDCIHYNTKKHCCRLGAKDEGKPTDHFYRDCPLGISVDKEEPVIPIVRGYTLGCPVCGSIVSSVQRYCDRCGQKLDWDGFVHKRMEKGETE